MIRERINGIPSGDKSVFAGVLATLLVWWIFDGRKRYGLRSKTL